MTIFLIIVLVLAGLAAVYFLLLAGVAWFSIRPPRMPQFVTPGLMGEKYETVSIKTPDNQTLRAWWVPAEGNTTVVFAHGYFTNRCEFVPFVTLFKERGANCVFFDHRAHGTSTGKRCTFGVEEAIDVAAVVDWVNQNRPGDKIVLVGNSMGGVACAINCAAHPLKVDGLILDSPYAKVGEAARGWWTFFARGKFKGFLRPCSIFGTTFSKADLKSVNLEAALEKIRGIPVLLLFASTDPLISQENAQKCIDAAGPHAEAVWFHKSNHARARFHEPELYSESVFEFLAKHQFLAHKQAENSGPETVLVQSQELGPA